MIILVVKIMETLFNINGKEILDIDTTILHTSKNNYNQDIIKLIEANAEVITTNKYNNIEDIPFKILAEFNQFELLKKDKLTRIDEYIINVLYSLTSNKKVIVFYDILEFIDSNIKKLVIKKLKEQDKKIINYTTEIEETIMLDYLILVHENKVIMEGKTEEVLLEEKIIKKLGFSLPCVVALSNGLKYYNVVNKTYFNKESLVDDLWK